MGRPKLAELLDRLIDALGLAAGAADHLLPARVSAPWVGHAGVTLIALSRLSPRQAATLASQVVVGQALPAGMLERIVAQTDGVPLFIEELTKAVLEGAGQDGRSPASALPMPSTLQASLMARLDRLPAAKQVAQIGAMIGREFSHELLAAVAGLPEAALAQGLDELVDAGLAFRRGTPPERPTFQARARAGRRLREPAAGHTTEAARPDRPGAGRAVVGRLSKPSLRCSPITSLKRD